MRRQIGDSWFISQRLWRKTKVSWTRSRSTIALGMWHGRVEHWQNVYIYLLPFTVKVSIPIGWKKEEAPAWPIQPTHR